MRQLNEFLQIAKAAEFLGVCQNTLRNWGRDGKINEYRHPVNNYRLYKQAELEHLFSNMEPVKSAKAAQSRKQKPK